MHWVALVSAVLAGAAEGNVNTTEIKPNVDLLKRTLARVEAAEEEWLAYRRRANNWVPGAGEPECVPPELVWCQSKWCELYSVADDSGPCGTALCFAGWALLEAGMTPAEIRRLVADELISEQAEARLGLTTEQCCDLFCGRNKLVDLRRIVAEICGGG